MDTVFAGIQPSGQLRPVNHLGAVRNWVSLQGTHEYFSCIVGDDAVTP